MLEKREEVATDEFGLHTVYSEEVHIDLLTCTLDECREFMQWMQPASDAIKLAQVLDAIEADIVGFWAREGLPTSVDDKRHPAAEADKGSWLRSSWAMRCDVARAREAVKAGNVHLVGFLLFKLGSASAEIRMSRRHGLNARGGRKSNAARPRAHESRRLGLREQLGPRDQEMLRLDARTTAKSKSARAKHIKLLLDRWVNRQNEGLEVKDHIRSISEGEIARKLPTRK